MFYVFMFSTENSINFIYRKKGKQTKFLLQTQTICLNGFNTSICFQSYQTYWFSADKKANFPSLRNFSTAKELFNNLETFPQSKNFSTVKEIFHSHGNFPQIRKLFTRNFIHKHEILPQRKFYLNQENLPQTKIFTQ